MTHIVTAAVTQPFRPHPCLLGDIVRVDRSISFVRDGIRLLHPELEKTGPAVYELAHVRQWFLDTQEEGDVVTGTAIYERLKADGVLESHLGFSDLLAIQKLGVEVYRKHYPGRVANAWKSVAEHPGLGLCVPSLVEFQGEVAEPGWVPLHHWMWNESYPALYFES